MQGIWEEKVEEDFINISDQLSVLSDWPEEMLAAPFEYVDQE